MAAFYGPRWASAPRQQRHGCASPRTHRKSGKSEEKTEERQRARNNRPRATRTEHLPGPRHGHAVQLEGVGAVAVGGVVLEVLGQVDDHDGVERAFLFFVGWGRVCFRSSGASSGFSGQSVGRERERVGGGVRSSRSRACVPPHLDADAAADAQLLRDPRDLAGGRHLDAQLADLDDRARLFALLLWRGGRGGGGERERVCFNVRVATRGSSRKQPAGGNPTDRASRPTVRSTDSICGPDRRARAARRIKTSGRRPLRCFAHLLPALFGLAAVIAHDRNAREDLVLLSVLRVDLLLGRHDGARGEPPLLAVLPVSSADAQACCGGSRRGLERGMVL